MKVATLPALSICVRLLVRLFCLSFDKLWALGHNYWQPANVARNAALVADSSLEFSLACCKCVAIETAMMPVSPRRATTRHGMTFRRTPLPRLMALATGRTHSDRPKSVWRFRLQHFSRVAVAQFLGHQNLVSNMICSILVDCKPISISLSHSLSRISVTGSSFPSNLKEVKAKFNFSTVFWTFQFHWPWNRLNFNNTFGFGSALLEV